MTELKLRKATEADYTMLQQCLWDEWPGTEKEDLSKLHTIIAEGAGFMSFHTKYPFPTVRHVYIRPEKRSNGIGRAFAYWFTKWLVDNGHSKFVILIPKARPYLEEYLKEITPGFPGASVNMYEEDDNLKYFLLEVNHA